MLRAALREISETMNLLDVLTFDYRGHGLSPGKRGVVRSYEDFLTDLRAAFAWNRKRNASGPVYLFGHSNGGQVALHAVLREISRIDGLIVSNPSLKITAPVPLYKYLIGLVLRRVAPSVTLTSTVSDEDLTRDPESLAQRKSDVLRHSRISAPLFFGMIEGGERVLAQAERIHLPLLMLLGGADPIVDPRVSRAFFDRIASVDKTLRIYPGVLHEPLNDLGREKVREDILTWLEPHLASIESSRSAAINRA